MELPWRSKNWGIWKNCQNYEVLYNVRHYICYLFFDPSWGTKFNGTLSHKIIAALIMEADCITSLFSLMTTDNLFLSFIFPKSWTVLTTQLGGFNQGISNPWQYHYQGNTLWLLSTELLKPLVPNVVMIKRMNKRVSCTIVRPTAIPSHH